MPKLQEEKERKLTMNNKACIKFSNDSGLLKFNSSSIESWCKTDGSMYRAIVPVLNAKCTDRPYNIKIDGFHEFIEYLNIRFSMGNDCVIILSDKILPDDMIISMNIDRGYNEI